jgi:uncharacterized protein
MDVTYRVRNAAPVIDLPVDQRAVFISRTYLHLFGAIALFTAIEAALFITGIAYPLATAMMSVSWLLILGGFMVVGWLGSRVAARAESLPAQYAALFGYVFAEALIFVPLLVMAELSVGAGVIASAAAVTLVGFAALTGIAWTSRRDFSFLGGLLKWVGIGAVVGIIASVAFGFTLGTWFSVLMVVFAGGAILYDTSRVMHHFPESRYVAASLSLFASVALLFWYVLRIFMARD